MKERERRPLVFNLHHFALDDGPGIRTTVFMKGCPLSCIWCHNPESIDGHREIAFYPELCIGCGDCMKACHKEAINLTAKPKIQRNRCTTCGRCVEACPSTALRVIGKYYPVPKLVKILLMDKAFYDISNGGVTFSGGEPALHANYLGAVMKRLKESKIHIAIQTSGMFDMDEFQTKLLLYIDLIYFDIKLLDSKRHKEYTGQGNEKILENFRHLVRSAKVEIRPRVPLIPRLTATRENLTAIVDFLDDMGCKRYELLPYNSGGIKKRLVLEKQVPLELINLPLDVEKETGWKEMSYQQKRRE